MNTKLTLSLNAEVIRKAKSYAKKHNTSLSDMVETFLDKVSGKAAEKSEITPVVKTLMGVAKAKKNSKPKDEYIQYLEKKYK